MNRVDIVVYPRISQDIPAFFISWDILGYLDNLALPSLVCLLLMTVVSCCCFLFGGLRKTLVCFFPVLWWVESVRNKSDPTRQLKKPGPPETSCFLMTHQNCTRMVRRRGPKALRAGCSDAGDGTLSGDTYSVGHTPQAPKPGLTRVRHAPTHSPTVPRRTPRRTPHHTHISFYYNHSTVLQRVLDGGGAAFHSLEMIGRG